MTEREKIRTLMMGILLVILGFWILDLMEQQKKQNARLRALRKQLEAGNGFDTDAEQLKKDWQNVRNDLRTASKKALPNVV